jgi:hypothetical protein
MAQNVAVTDDNYAQRLADAVVSDLRSSLADFAPVETAARVLPDDDAIEVRVRRSSDGAEESDTYSVGRQIYHYIPDGKNVEKHAGWISELFQEDHTWLVHQGYHGPPLPVALMHPDGTVEHLTAEEAALPQWIDTNRDGSLTPLPGVS